jgi:hypothetical protein
VLSAEASLQVDYTILNKKVQLSLNQISYKMELRYCMQFLLHTDLRL